MENTSPKSKDFIRTMIDEDMKTGKWDNKVHTRFPPEPNGYLHIGHAKSICLNFGLAQEYDGQCNLRFDDTNPLKEENEYVEAIKEDVRWLGFNWEDRELYASDYFEQLYAYAEQLIEKGLAYVDDLTADEIREHRGTLTSPGTNSPYRDRSVEENLDLFRKMRAGEFEDGARVLRAKIDMAHPNMVMRDPTLYRIRRAHHQRTGDAWCIYPMYDFTHCLSDSIEGITHSLCTLEFKNNRDLYNWVLEALEVYHPEQTEFARLNITYTVLSKRRLIQLVTENCVNGWDDPRMPTMSGLRRRGFTPRALRNFCEMIGMSTSESQVQVEQLEYCLRQDLNEHSPRVMGVLDPVKVVIENYPEDQTEEFDMPMHPENTSYGSRKVPFSRELYVERDDYREEAPRKWFRMAPGKEVRLRYAYYVTVKEAIHDDDGKLIEIRCTYDPETRGGWSTDGRKVKGTMHWVSAKHAVDAEVRLYDRLFTRENPMDVEEGKDFKDYINPESLSIVKNCKLEPYLRHAGAGSIFQFERLGYFCADPDGTIEAPVFNRTITLRDTWARIARNK